MQDEKKCKPFLTYQEQMKLLQKRNCRITDDKFCENVLKRIGYYRLTGYLLPFRVEGSDLYQEGTCIEKVYQIYELDRNLRSLLFHNLKVIEVSLKACLAHFHAAPDRYGPIGYYQAESFGSKHNHESFLEKIHKEINHQRNSLIVKHHKEQYESEFPLWVAVGFFTFGMTAYFYGDLKRADKKSFVREYYPSINDKTMESWLKCCTDLRNICAHYDRLYFRTFTAIPRGVADLPEDAKRRLWGVVCVLKELYPDSEDWNQGVASRVKELMNAYQGVIERKHIGFPDDWEIRIQKDNC